MPDEPAAQGDAEGHQQGGRVLQAILHGRSPPR
jgi:hypothetical protein